ncbi:hypothetical protein N8261_03390 [Flavobacteriaceae bacterium]|nr:hypothetical protein [Flavobacteriaceae bacterium]
MGTTFSSSITNKNTKNNVSKPVDILRKEVSFLSNPVTEQWSQSPRNSDEFYNFTKADVNHDKKKTSTRKEKNEKKTKRRKSITRYYEIKRHTDLIDEFKPKRKRKIGLDEDDNAQIGGWYKKQKRKNTRKRKGSISPTRRNNSNMVI